MAEQYMPQITGAALGLNSVASKEAEVNEAVDIYEDNGERFIRVIDYKTGEKKFSLDNIIFGINYKIKVHEMMNGLKF